MKKKNKPDRDKAPGVMIPAADLAAMSARHAAFFRAQCVIAGTALEMIQKIKTGEIRGDDEAPETIKALADHPGALAYLEGLGHLFAAAGMLATRGAESACPFDQALRASLAHADCVQADLPRSCAELIEGIPDGSNPRKAVNHLLEAAAHDAPAGPAHLAIMGKPWAEIHAEAKERETAAFTVDEAGRIEPVDLGGAKPAPAPDKAPDKASPPKWSGDRWRSGEDSGSDWNPDGTPRN